MEDVTPYLSEIGTQVMGVLLDRLDCELSEKDAVAVATAVTQAAQRGFYTGTATCATGANAAWRDIREQLAAQAPGARIPEFVVMPEYSGDPAIADLWAERYGGDRDEDA